MKGESRVVSVICGPYGGGTVRAVQIGAEEWGTAKTIKEQLDLVYYYGQNDVQPRPIPSVSVGDSILLGGKEYGVLPNGFKEVA